MLIISGVLACLTIFGAIFGWVYIWMGLSLKGAGDSIEFAYENRDGNQATQAFAKLGTFFKILGIVILISLIPFILYFGAVIVFLIVALVSGVT